MAEETDNFMTAGYWREQMADLPDSAPIKLRMANDPGPLYVELVDVRVAGPDELSNEPYLCVGVIIECWDEDGERDDEDEDDDSET